MEEFFILKKRRMRIWDAVFSKSFGGKICQGQPRSGQIKKVIVSSLACVIENFLDGNL